MRKLIIFFAIASALCACSSIDCPLNNKVYAQYKFAGDGMSDGTIITVTTSLSQAEGDDSVLINKMEYADSISLPMSYARAEDVFYFKFEKSNGSTITDTVKVAKKNMPHFESVDCNPAFFHTITGVEHTRHAIESIIINNNTVNWVPMNTPKTCSPTGVTVSAGHGMGSNGKITIMATPMIA